MHPRFEGRVKIDPSSGCWEWQLYVAKNGYGQMTYLNKQGVSAHRASYELHTGAIPDDMTVDHICFNTICVNPEHLRLLTRADNLRYRQSMFAVNCKNGHPWNEENTYVSPAGGRTCRKCNLAAARRKYERRKLIQEATP